MAEALRGLADIAYVEVSRLRDAIVDAHAHTPKGDERGQRLLAQAQADAAKFLARAEKAEVEDARLRKAMKEAIKSIGMASDLIETNRSNLVKDPRNNVVAPDVELIWRGLCELADEIGRLTAALSPEATKGGDPDTAPEPETARAHIAQPAREDDPVSASEQWFAVFHAGDDLEVRPLAYQSREACSDALGGQSGYLGAIERSWLGNTPVGAAPPIDIVKVRLVLERIQTLALSPLNMTRIHFEAEEAIADLERPRAQSEAAEAAPAIDIGKVREASFQSRVEPWMDACFGPVISADKIERNHRFIEEALELVQSNGCTKSEAHQLVDYVYGRDQGDINQEVGGVMVTLAALCLASDVDMHEAGETELRRVWTMVEKIRAKQANKPKHSPLPEALLPKTQGDGHG